MLVFRPSVQSDECNMHKGTFRAIKRHKNMGGTIEKYKKKKKYRTNVCVRMCFFSLTDTVV